MENNRMMRDELLHGLTVDRFNDHVRYKIATMADAIRFCELWNVDRLATIAFPVEACGGLVSIIPMDW